MSPITAWLAWRALPVILTLAWFLAVIGGFSWGGVVHLLLAAAVGVFAYQLASPPSA